jgi:hypothetical protein
MIESKRMLWNAMCDRCQQAIEKGQTITANVVNAMAADVRATVTAFNDSLGRSKSEGLCRPDWTIVGAFFDATTGKSPNCQF